MKLEALLWLLSMVFCIYLLRTKWLDTSKRGINLSLTMLALVNACMFTDSLQHTDQTNWSFMAALFSLFSLTGWAIPAIKANIHAYLAKKVT